MWGVNPRAILNLTHSAGFVLEELARMEDLVGFLQYPKLTKTHWDGGGGGRGDEAAGGQLRRLDQGLP